MAAKFPVYLLADSAEGAKRESDLTGVPDVRGGSAETSARGSCHSGAVR